MTNDPKAKLFEQMNTLDPEIIYEHKCQYCGAMTSEPDENCYKAPKKKSITISYVEAKDQLIEAQRFLIKFYEEQMNAQSNFLVAYGYTHSEQSIKRGTELRSKITELENQIK